MPSERVQRRIDRLLDQADEALERDAYQEALERAKDVLALDPDNSEAMAFIVMAERRIGATIEHESSAAPLKPAEFDTPSDQPTSFASGRYTVNEFLGEGGKKQVYLAHDNTLDRDVAFALIKTEGLDETSRERVRREAQAMGRMGTHPCIMPIYDLGEETDASGIAQPFMVQPLMSGGDVEGLVDDAEGPLELDRAIEIATQTAQGLSFAHSKGIVHRDLKPGNVWLDEEGAAKIGDFGLAVATDRSRLTVEKVMVGTVSYMPPEQATGGEVTPRADLYSLGAMLYEMCTGRAPFMGDDDIGIISQHINTPPVAPSWHNNQIPKTLDSLILRLLAKDPAERPSDADEVLAALDSVDLTAVEEREEESKGSLDAMAGGVFVGRHREMDQLKSIFEDVLSGRGRMVTLVGEPGIGKTRTAQELATYAGMRGAEVLWGRSYESGGAPPYWPWVQAIRSHIAATEPQELRSQLGATASVIAELVSDVKAKLPDIPAPTPIEDPDSARFRLFDSISTFLKNISVNQSLVLMLEDLHWSDKPSLMLLEFVARELANSRILIVGNYRDMELNRRHPLSVTLGDLSRERLFERVVLRGLQKHDVERFIEIAAGIKPPAALVETVHSQTEGNPLFVTETVRLLIQEGDITSGQSSKGGTTSWEIRIPEGVREVIGRRLDRLSERCNALLTIAAVIGRQFRYDVLKTLAEETTDNQLLDVIDEALSARIIEELPDEVGFYQFTHAQMQETLIGELSHTRAVRVHASIAEALEQYYGGNAEEHAAELVEHFAEAETVLGVEKVLNYSLIAGHAAMARYAFDGALPHFERAAALANTLSRNVQRANILAGLGRARGQTSQRSDMQKAVDPLVEAFTIYASLGETKLAIRTALAEFPHVHGSVGMADMLRDAKGMAAPESAEMARILAQYAQWASFERGENAIDAADQAIEISEKLGDNQLRLEVLAGIAVLATLHPNYELRDSIVSKTLPLARSLKPSPALARACETVLWKALSEGDLELADEFVKIKLESSRQMGSAFERAIAYLFSSMVTQVRGQLDDAVQLLNTGLKYSPHEPRLLYSLVILKLRQGDAGPLKEWAAEADKQSGPHPYVLLLARFLGYDVPLPDGFPEKTSDDADDESWEPSRRANATLALAFAAATGQLDDDPVELYGRLLDSQLGQQGDFILPRQLVLAMLSSRIGNNDTAEGHFKEFLRECGIKKHRPWTADGLVHYSEMLLDRNASGDREKAIELQDEAISIATELGMKPLLERVLAKREKLKA